MSAGTAAAMAELAAATGAAAPGVSRTPVQLVAHCQNLTERFLSRQCVELFRLASEDLMARAGSADSANEAQVCFDELQGLHRVQEPIESGFLEQVGAGFKAIVPGAEPALDEEPPDYDELALVDTQSMDDGVRILRVITETAPSLKNREFHLTARFSSLLAAPLKEDANPVSARAIALAFHEAMQNLGAERVTRKALYGALQASVMAALGDLQDELNDYLSAAGIMPDGAPRVVKAQPSAASQREPAPAKVDSPPKAGPIVPQPDDRGSPRMAGPQRAAQEPVLPSPAAAPVARQAGSDHGGVTFARTTRAVRALSGLAASLEQGAAFQAEPAQTEPKPGAQRVLDHALAEIQRSGIAESWGEAGEFAFDRRLMLALEDYGITLNDHAIRDIVALMARLFEGLLRDPLVEEWARTFLRRVSLPVLRIALGDGSFFASESHLARRFLNCLCTLAPVPASPGDEVDELRQRAEIQIRGLLTFEPFGLDAFQHALNGLEEVARAQQALRERRGADGASVVMDPGSDLLEGEHPGARAQMQQTVSGAELPVQTMAQLRNGDAGRIRIDDHEFAVVYLVSTKGAAGSYRFADACGTQVWDLTEDECAQALSRGALRFSEDARLAPVERAMCHILDQMHDRLESKALFDPVTGAGNLKRLEQAFMALNAHRCGPRENHHLLYIGLETIAEIEFHGGAAAVDALLKQYAAVLERQLGPSATLSHLGHGHFAALLPGSSRGDIEHLIQRHCRSIAVAKCNFKGQALPLRVAVGALALQTGAEGMAVAVQAARKCFERARDKEQGFEFPARALGAQRGPAPPAADSRDGLVEQFIEQDRLALRCQRIEPLGAAGPPNYELLLGVRRDDGVLEPPGKIIAAAEADGQIAVLDRWVVGTAVRWLADNEARLDGIGRFSVNLSGRSITDPTVAIYIDDLLSEYPSAVDRLTIEITESAAIEDTTRAIRFVESLRARGCRFALDDFGSGHASFSYLKLLPVDVLKIDGLFVRDIIENPTDEAMVRSIHQIADLLGLKTVAEFAENAAIIDRLREIGIDYAQGYGVEKPMPLAQLLAVDGPAGTERAAVA